jgi:hypothetical protein
VPVQYCLRSFLMRGATMRVNAPQSLAVGVLSGLLLCAEAAARPPLGGSFQEPGTRLPERPLEAVVDIALGKVAVNRSQWVRIDRLSVGPPVRFTLWNRTRRRQSIRIGILHLPDGDYDIHTTGPGSVQPRTGLNAQHLAGGWRFVLPAPQIGTALGASVRALTERLGRARPLLANRSEPELTRAMAALETAVRRARTDLQATRRLDVAIVPTGTRAAPVPSRGPWLSEEQMAQRWNELDRLQRGVVAAADRSGEAALANRFRRWFRVRMKPAGSGHGER